ncbi:MAG TPA: TIGR03435 family protein [Candidatus Acidoferrales bacterium]|nr:TIGR03435 family protein [Candidatus Acidoferrales bacterium]
MTVCCAFILLAASAPSQSTSEQPSTPQWEIAAGGKMAFDVVSVRQNTSGMPPHGDAIHSNVPLGPDDAYAPTGGLLSVSNSDVANFISFAYKLGLQEETAMRAELPKWTRTERFNIEARGRVSAAKDQMRLMMQALLTDRFKLVVHFEMHEQPIFNLVLVSPGKTGPQLTPYSDAKPCIDPMNPFGRSRLADGAPTPACGTMTAQDVPNGGIRVTAGDVTIQKIAEYLAALPPANIDRPVVDHTGLTGEFDFTIDLPHGLSRGGVSTDDTAPSFVDILRDQLGLKLESATGPVRSLVIDHIEEPTAN